MIGKQKSSHDELVENSKTVCLKKKRCETCQGWTLVSATKLCEKVCFDFPPQDLQSVSQSVSPWISLDYSRNFVKKSSIFFISLPLLCYVRARAHNTTTILYSIVYVGCSYEHACAPKGVILTRNHHQ